MVGELFPMEANEEHSLITHEDSGTDDEIEELDLVENMDEWCLADNSLESTSFITKHQGNDTSGETIKRRIGLVHAVALVVGGIIGSGIFISPRYVVRNASSIGETLLVWVFGGVLSMFGGLCFCELGTFIKKSGGEYIYLKLAYGRFIGFLFSWINIWVIEPCSFAILSLTFGLYATEPFFPSRGVASDNSSVKCHQRMVLVKLLAACSVCFLTAMNCVSIRLAARAQVLFTSFKILAVASIVIVALIRFLSGSATELNHNVFSGSAVSLGSIGHAFYSVMFAYGGWNSLNAITEEVKDPKKNFPRTLMISIPLVTLCYVLMNVAYFSVLTKQEILASDAVALTFASHLSPVLGAIMPAIVSLSCFGSLNSSLLRSSRVMFSIAREKQLPSCLAMIHRKSQAPIPAILMRAFLALLLLLPTNVENLLNWLMFVDWLIYGFVFVGLIWLRRKQSTIPRSFKVNILIPIFMTLVSLYFVSIPFISNPVESVFGLLVILCGIPVYFVFIKKKWLFKSERLNRLSSKVCQLIQVILNVAPVQGENWAVYNY